MTKATKVPELFGVTETCRELGTVSSNLDKISGLPAPVQRTAGGRIWLADDIRKFAREREARKVAQAEAQAA